MATIWLTCHRPFDRHNLAVNTTIRDLVKQHIVRWTGWSGQPHDVQWKLRIEQQTVAAQDSIVYFVGSFSTGVVRARLNQGQQNATDPNRRILRDREMFYSNGSRQRPPTMLGATIANAPAVSEVWIEACLFQVFDIRSSRPNWTPITLERTTKILAATALHELAHNKVEPVMQAAQPGWNLHTSASAGGAIFRAVPNWNVQPSQINLQLLRDHIAVPRPQGVHAHPAFAGQ